MASTGLKRTPFRVVVLAVLLLLACPGLSAQDKKMALTFDDLPALGPLGFFQPRELSNMILRTLDREGITAAGFVVAEKVDETPITFVVLEDWVSRDHLLGNQTYGDADLNDLGPDDFLEHVADGQGHLKRLSRAFPFDYRYLRYPFLHQGPTRKIKEKVAETLSRADYKIAHVTVKTSDDRFNSLYFEHQNHPDRLVELKEMFLEHVADSLDYAESQSEAVFGRRISQILWLHCGISTANFLEDLIGLIRSRGYQFVSLQEALEDPAYQTEETYAGPLGLTFTDRVAFTRGLPFDPDRGELSRRDLERMLENR